MSVEESNPQLNAKAATYSEDDSHSRDSIATIDSGTFNPISDMMSETESSSVGNEDKDVSIYCDIDEMYQPDGEQQ
jgi:hypothetical protein